MRAVFQAAGRLILPSFFCAGWKHHEVSAAFWKCHLDNRDPRDNAEDESTEWMKGGEREKTVKEHYGLISTRQGSFHGAGQLNCISEDKCWDFSFDLSPFLATLSPSPVFVAVIAVTRTLCKCWLSPIRPSIFMKICQIIHIIKWDWNS